MRHMTPREGSRENEGEDNRNEVDDNSNMDEDNTKLAEDNQLYFIQNIVLHILKIHSYF